MVKPLEVILMTHPLSQDDRAKVVQGQRNPFLVDGYEPDLYDVVRELVREGGPTDAVYTSDLKCGNIPARLAVDYLRSPKVLPIQQGRPIRYVETPLLRERARGPLECARYQVTDDGLTIVLEGKSIALPNGQPTQTALYPQFRTMDDFLYSLDDPSLGEDRAAIAKRINAFRDRYLRPYERTGGKLLIMGHPHWINHARNLLVDGDAASRPYEPLDNLASIRLFKESGQRRYRELNGSHTGNQANPVGTR